MIATNTCGELVDAFPDHSQGEPLGGAAGLVFVGGSQMVDPSSRFNHRCGDPPSQAWLLTHEYLVSVPPPRLKVRVRWVSGLDTISPNVISGGCRIAEVEGSSHLTAGGHMNDGRSDQSYAVRAPSLTYHTQGDVSSNNLVPLIQMVKLPLYVTRKKQLEK